MDRLTVGIDNCYGIKHLNTEFDFSEGSTHLVYAPNGSMKSSLANIFKDIRDKKVPVDRIFKHRKSSYNIKINGQAIEPDAIVIVDPYVDNFSNERVNTLLASSDLKSQYDLINKDMDDKLAGLMTSLSAHLSMKGNPAKDLFSAFPGLGSDLITLLLALESQVNETDATDFGWVSYQTIFNEKVVAFLETGEIQEKLAEYALKFNELIDKSLYFRKNGFNHNSAIDVSKNLSASGFFSAHHSLVLADQKDNKTLVEDLTTFERVIAEERDKILEDPALKKRFDAIDKAITKNAELRALRQYLEEFPSLASELKDSKSFRQKVVLSFLRKSSDIYQSFVQSYRLGREGIDRVVELARHQRTKWESVVKLFNERFSVPFIIKIENKENVLLKGEAASLVFDYTDDDDHAVVGRDELATILSVGERRAYHLLNVIYDLEYRRENSIGSLVIVDDIADSFDYRNKYAIIQYLKDVSSYPDFKQIILTHNFDFFRTVQSRLHVGRKKNCHMSIKANHEVRLVAAEYLDPFSYYRTRIGKDENITVAAIPFVRNISEYSEGKESANYLKLTSLLHFKLDTPSITNLDLETIFNRVLGTSIKMNKPGDSVYSSILGLAAHCYDGTETANLEKKIILSIAIRLLTEQFLVGRLGVAALAGVESNQTMELVSKYQLAFPDDISTHQILEAVSLMTPENIHFNSFMYEPLLDLADRHLHQLYTNVLGLK